VSFINTIPDFERSLDKNVVQQIEHFFIKVNERILYKMGVLPSYDTGGDAALGLDVEYFHFNITGDDRMRYMGQNVVLEDHLSDRNKFCNAVITHLYGGRCINSLLSGKTDPKKAHLDYERINTDPVYVQWMYENAAYAKLHGYKFYGTTELHTSLQTAARNFVRHKYSEPDKAASNTDIVEWVAGWISSGLVDDILSSKHLSEVYAKINTLPGIGAYYGYHLSVDSSLIPGTLYHHDEPFCVPGPGCCITLDMMFPTLKAATKKMPYGELICWIEQNQKKLYPRVPFHEALWNLKNDVTGKKVFSFEQDKFMVYGLEVGHCQYGIYDRLTKHPNLIEKRRCGTDPSLSAIKAREEGKPVEFSTKNEKANTNATCLLEF
jgi:hypothetical protein